MEWRRISVVRANSNLGVPTWHLVVLRQETGLRSVTIAEWKPVRRNGSELKGWHMYLFLCRPMLWKD